MSSQSRSDNIPGEPILIETSEKQQEELVITLDITKTHSQLRRLKNEGCALQDSQTIVTAIPYNKTRAMFECIKFPEEPGMDATTVGYVMFECGLEGISTKIVKRFLTIFWFIQIFRMSERLSLSTQIAVRKVRKCWKQYHQNNYRDRHIEY